VAESARLVVMRARRLIFIFAIAVVIVGWP